MHRNPLSWPRLSSRSDWLILYEATYNYCETHGITITELLHYHDLGRYDAYFYQSPRKASTFPMNITFLRALAQVVIHKRCTTITQTKKITASINFRRYCWVRHLYLRNYQDFFKAGIMNVTFRFYNEIHITMANSSMTMKHSIKMICREWNRQALNLYHSFQFYPLTHTKVNVDDGDDDTLYWSYDVE
jgi:hypothetical protein